MNLSDGVGDAPTLASLSENKEMTPCTVRRMKKGTHKKKKKKTHHIVP
jgi:hypothetical protein